MRNFCLSVFLILCTICNVEAKVKINGFKEKDKSNIINLLKKIEDINEFNVQITNVRNKQTYASSQKNNKNCIVNINEDNNINFFKFILLHEIGHCYYNSYFKGDLEITENNKFYDKRDFILNYIKEKNENLIQNNITIKQHPFIYLNEMAADAWASYWIVQYNLNINLDDIADIRLQNINHKDNIYYTYDLITQLKVMKKSKKEINDLIEENFIKNLFYYD